MSVITKTMSGHRTAIYLPALPLAARPGLRNFILSFLVLLSAFGVLVVKDYSRCLFIRYQNMQQIHEQRNETWSKLLLEQSTLSRQARIERVAEHRLGMKLPTPQQVSVIKVR